MNGKGRRYFWIVMLAALLGMISAAPSLADYGPAADVNAARLAEHAVWHSYCASAQCSNMRIPNVTVVGRYALVTWEDRNTGGESLLRNDQGHWHRIGHGGGVMNVDDVVGYGVPRPLAVKLVTHHAASSDAQHLHKPR